MSDHFDESWIARKQKDREQFLKRVDELKSQGYTDEQIDNMYNPFAGIDFSKWSIKAIGGVPFEDLK